MAHLNRLYLLSRCGARALRNSQFIVASRVPSDAKIFTNQVRTRFNPANPNLIYPRAGTEETDEEFDERMLKIFEKPDIDGWELRKVINDMHSMDLIPEPKIMIAVLKACRRVNDHSLAIRYLEAVKFKTGGRQNIWDYLMEEIRPTLNELGVSTLEEMDYHEPELALGDPYRAPLIETPPNVHKIVT